MSEKAKYDMRALGLAIKKARKDQGLTREKVGSIIGIEPRYLTNIENKGQNPSLQVLYKLVTLFHISVDQYFYGNNSTVLSSQCRQIMHSLETLSENDLIIISATIKGINEAKEADKG